jgi:hypothetical protein
MPARNPPGRDPGHRDRRNSEEQDGP